MKNTKSLFVLAFASLLFSCGGEKKISYELSWLSPTGSPTLAFYSEAENSNWVSTSTPAALIPAAFASASYDAIVFDGITGLNLIEKQQRAYRLASWINEGSFYLVSAKYDKDGAKNLENRPTIDAFVASGTASVLSVTSQRIPFNGENIRMEVPLMTKSFMRPALTWSKRICLVTLKRLIFMLWLSLR